MNLKKLLFLTIFSLGTTWVVAQQNFYFTFNYSPSLPMGDTKDYIDQFSWRGVSIEGHWEGFNNLSIGYYFGWNIFNQKLTGDFVDGTRTLSGTQLRYVNAFPLFLEGRYHLGAQDAVRPYLGVGAGVVRTRQRTEMGIFASNTNTWQFGFAPSAGVLIPVGYSSAINVGAKYNYALKNSKTDFNHSYLSINVGISWMR